MNDHGLTTLIALALLAGCGSGNKGSETDATDTVSETVDVSGDVLDVPSDTPVDTAIDTLVGDTADVPADAPGDSTPDTEDAIPDPPLDTATDGPEDTSVDTGPDTPPDSAMDSVPDTAIDTAPDSAMDSVPDTAIDTAPDTATDTIVDTTPDTVTDTLDDTAMDTAMDTAVDDGDDTTPDLDAAEEPDGPCVGPGCEAATCADPAIISTTGTYTADTSAQPDDQEGSCQPSDGGEAVFELDIAVESDLHVDTAGSDYDTVVYVRSGDCLTGIEAGCNDDVVPSVPWSRVEVEALPAGTYWIVVDSTSPDDGGDLVMNVAVTPTTTLPPLAVEDDPLVRMPGTQPENMVTIEAPSRCLNCHADYDVAVEPGWNWKGSMMAQAARDFLFWSTFAVAAQDSIWATGRPNGTDICERCHFPGGWVEGRSDPPDASAMTGADFDGVHCDVCHQMWDPFFETTYDGTREGADWLDYWDETNASTTPSQPEADVTYAEDAVLAADILLFNGTPFYDASNLPVNSGYTENGGGQYYVSPGGEKRASFADAPARHTMLYSRHHKSKYACSSCHDVSNPVLANLAYADTPPGDGTTVLPTEEHPAHSYYHVERTHSEFMLSDFGLPGGAPGVGPFDPAVFETSSATNSIARCLDCHMADQPGVGCDKSDGIFRPSGSTEHPLSGQPVHDLTGGNMFVSWVLASATPGSPNHDAVNEGLVDQGPAVLTLDMSQGEGVDPDALLDGVDRALSNLERAATIQNVTYAPSSGDLSFRVRNNTGHKLISGYPEGRRMFVNVRVFSGTSLVWEVNPWDDGVGTLRGLPSDYSTSSPPLSSTEEYRDDLVYEMQAASTLTGEPHTFHFVLATGRWKDNRIPPVGFRIAEAPDRLCEPVWDGISRSDLFTPAEYAGGWDDVAIPVAPGGDRVEIRLYYQTTTREYVEFLRDEINGVGTTLPSPTAAGNAIAYVSTTDPFFDSLVAWGDTVWQIWDHNRGVPGAAPVLMTETTWTP